jgi:hypothetical protein
MLGEDVARLHSGLARLGYAIAAERSGSRLGKTTQTAVIDFQHSKGDFSR